MRKAVIMNKSIKSMFKDYINTQFDFILRFLIGLNVNE